MRKIMHLKLIREHLLQLEMLHDHKFMHELCTNLFLFGTGFYTWFDLCYEVDAKRRAT